ncbi:OmpH family outer membrane protein [Pseudooceanicola onchidii]|uniref:OmpH family outer membrane protein n=1 Tax=Pseudooceanicola onchidii TaxID=2562279 RepID=UPI001F0DCCA6|nr:OmpH family outer membrane protein [Pseudooceanicola onchidii]
MHPRWFTSTIRAVGVSAALFAAGPVAAQSGFEPGRTEGTEFSAILTLDTDRLLTESAAGRAIDEELAETSAVLAAENRRIEAELTEEEKDLSVRRSSLTAEAFRAEAAAFDAKVNDVREEQDAKLRDLQARAEAARRRILQAANPVLASLMQDTGAVAILEKNTVIVALQSVDITALAIQRLDAAMADGGLGLITDDDSPSQDPAAPGVDAPTAPAD